MALCQGKATLPIGMVAQLSIKHFLKCFLQSKRVFNAAFFSENVTDFGNFPKSHIFSEFRALWASSIYIWYLVFFKCVRIIRVIRGVPRLVLLCTIAASASQEPNAFFMQKKNDFSKIKWEILFGLCAISFTYFYVNGINVNKNQWHILQNKKNAP